MNTIVKILILALALLVTKVNAQDFQGIATYKSKRKLEIKLDSTQVNSEMHQQLMESLKKQFEKTYNLSFNKEASIYKEEEALSPPQQGGMQVVMINTSGADILYKNLKEDRYSKQNDVFGKIFLIKDKLNKSDWKLESESKNIGEYTCFKATTTREQEKRRVGSISINKEKDLEEAEENKVPEMETITITAWYTPQIPVTNGPGNYHGLPGLILEINDGSETVICSKIVLNPNDLVDISEPKKGKEVTQAEFDEIMEKKMKEMKEQYNSKRGDGHEVEIKIGG